MTSYFRPLVQTDASRPPQALPLAQGWGWFTHVEHVQRGQAAEIIGASQTPSDVLARLMAPRKAVAGISLRAPVVMGILNVTPDSFSDGGLHETPEQAAEAGEAMTMAGAQILDIGGESTRPGAHEVPLAEEIARVAPVIKDLTEAGIAAPISIDTRKAAVAEAALDAGARIVNDVSGFTFDPALAGLCAAREVPVCVMHSQGEPATMHLDPHYDNVVLDVYDALAARIDALVAQGIPRTRIIADPGIGFGKTLEHNLAILNQISLFHGLSVPILLGVSRKRFVGTIGNAPQAEARAPGSIAVGLAAVAQGVQILRVHDVAETAQALALWRAVQSGEFNG